MRYRPASVGKNQGVPLTTPALASPTVPVYPLIVRAGIRCARTMWRLFPRSIRVRFQPRIAAIRTQLRALLSS